MTFADHGLIKEAGLEPPHVTRLALALGLGPRVTVVAHAEACAQQLYGKPLACDPKELHPGLHRRALDDHLLFDVARRGAAEDNVPRRLGGGA